MEHQPIEEGDVIERLGRLFRQRLTALGNHCMKYGDYEVSRYTETWCFLIFPIRKHR